MASAAATGRLIAQDARLFMRAEAIGALAGDRAYVVAVAAPAPACMTGFYLLRLTGDGHPAALTRLLVPQVHAAVWSLAVTPDGNTIAYAASGCIKGSPGYFAVTSVATGRTRRWGGVNLAGVSTGDLALSGNLRPLGTLRGPGFPSEDSTGQSCVLNRDASGR